MRRAELLVKQVQRATENERVGTQDGISLEEYYQYLTDGLRFLQRKIMTAHAQAFRTSLEVTVDGSETVSYPFDLFAKNRVITVEYSPTSLDADYRPLSKEISKARFSTSGYPSQYILESSGILINSIPTSGSYRITYDKMLPALDKRRATVASRTIGATSLTALTLSGYTAADYDLYDHLTLVDFNGVVKMRGIPYTAVNSGTGVVTIQGSSYTFPTGSTCTVGDYVCLGSYSSTHPQIDDSAEDFLIAYATKRIMNRDASLDAGELTADMAQMLTDIVEVYASGSDTDEIPVTSGAYFGEFF